MKQEIQAGQAEALQTAMPLDAKIPNLIIAGAPKCGSTSLFNWLSAHPEVCASIVKETYFLMDADYPLFRSENNYHTHGVHGYESFFRHCESGSRVLLEATPDYLYQRTALDVIEDLPSSPLVLFILRKPSERVYSLYQFARNNLALIGKDVSFSAFVGMITGETGATILTNRPILQRAILHSQYIDYLQPWLDRLGNKRIGVLLFEDMRDHPERFMTNLSERIGIAPAFYNGFDFAVHNSTYAVKNQLLHRMKRRLAEIVPQGAYRQALNKIYSSLNTGAGQKKSADDLKSLRELDQHFSDYNRKLKESCSLDLSAWVKI